MSEEIKNEEVKGEETTPEDLTGGEPTPDPKEEQTEVQKSIAEKLEEKEEEEIKVESNEPKGKNPMMVDLNNLTQEQIQDLQEKFANTPRRKKAKDSFHTIELRKIDAGIIVEWGQTYFDLKKDPVNRREVMKTMIPVKLHGSDKFIDILWKEEFMSAEKATCRILKMQKEDKPRVVGTTLKRDDNGGLTSQEVEMYVNEVEITLTVLLPNNEEAIINGKFAN